MRLALNPSLKREISIIGSVLDSTPPQAGSDQVVSAHSSVRYYLRAIRIE